MTTIDLNYFLTSDPAILDNDDGLRKIQIDSYIEICNHFLVNNSNEDAIAVLPTGSGKTGVMAIAPFGISKGRVLIITPQLVIKDHVVDSLDPSHPENFWLRHKIFEHFSDLPIVVEYDKETHQSELDESNIVILNIHKLSTRSRNSLLKRVNQNYFDMIIIDEAHHSPAQTWKNALDYFHNAKVLKLTGTPFRHDRKPIEGKEVINYRLGQAMTDRIVKTLQNFTILPETIYLTIDNDNSKSYTIQELEEKNIKDRNYIERSVAYSQACNQQIIDSSINELNKRKESSNVPHKIIAVCCSIQHAEDVKVQYENSGISAVVVHSNLSKKQKQEALRKVESHQIDSLIHVAMLGEGYDHPYLSVAAIFRPFKSLAPYSQFIGRILRRIPENEANSKIDNIGSVIAHNELGLMPLWKEYMKEQDLHNLIKHVKNTERQQRNVDKLLKQTKNLDIGNVITNEDITIESEYYEYTIAAKEYEDYENDLKEKSRLLKEIFPSKDESERMKIARQESTPVMGNPLLKNPRKYRMILREDFSQKVQFQIPAELILEYNLSESGTELNRLPVNFKFKWTLQNATNTGIIAKYLNAVLSDKFDTRSKWTIKDYENALKDLDNIVSHLRKMMENIL